MVYRFETIKVPYAKVKEEQEVATDKTRKVKKEIELKDADGNVHIVEKEVEEPVMEVQLVETDDYDVQSVPFEMKDGEEIAHIYSLDSKTIEGTKMWIASVLIKVRKNE